MQVPKPDPPPNNGIQPFRWRPRPIRIRRPPTTTPAHHPRRHRLPESEKSVFQLFPGPSVVCLEEVRTAYEVCSPLSGAQKEACYIVFGLDGRAVEMFLPIVEELDKAYHAPSAVKNLNPAKPKHKHKRTYKKKDGQQL